MAPEAFLAGCRKTPRLPFDMFRANGVGVESVDEFPFMLSPPVLSEAEGSKHNAFSSQYCAIINSISTRDVFSKVPVPRAEPFRARSMGLYLAGFAVSSLRSDLRLRAPFGSEPQGRGQPNGHHHSEGGGSHGLGQNATSAFLCPRSSRLAPRLLDGYLLMNSLVKMYLP